MAKRLRFDSATVDRILDGSLLPEDAPPELSRVASTIAAAAEVPAAAPIDTQFLASLAAEVRAHPSLNPAHVTPRTPVLKRILTVKAGVLAGVLAFGATGAAAATNNLPDGAQHGLATAARHIGLNLPDSANDHARDATSKDKGKDNGTADDEATTPDDENGNKPSDNHGAEVSDVAHNTETTGADHGAAVCAVASDDKCTEHRGSGDDHAVNGEDQREEHSPTTAVTPPQSEDHGGATNGADDHSGPDEHGSDHGGSGRD